MGGLTKVFHSEVEAERFANLNRRPRILVDGEVGSQLSVSGAISLSKRQRGKQQRATQPDRANDRNDELALRVIGCSDSGVSHDLLGGKVVNRSLISGRIGLDRDRHGLKRWRARSGAAACNQRHDYQKRTPRHRLPRVTNDWCTLCARDQLSTVRVVA